MVECVSRICRFCLNKCNEFEMIDKRHHEVLKAILPNDLTMSNEPVLCRNCIYSINKWYSFKTASLYKKNHLWVTKEGAIMEACLFCKKLSIFGSFITLNTEQSSFRTIVEEYLPEMNIHKKMCPIICVSCYESVQENVGFIVGCLSVETEIKTFLKMVGTHNKGQVDLRSVVDFIAVSKIKYEQCNSSVIEIEENCDKTKSKVDSCNSIKEENEDEVTVTDVKVESIWNEEGNKIIDQNIVENLQLNCDEIDVNTLNKETKVEENEVKEAVDTIKIQGVLKSDIKIREGREGARPKQKMLIQEDVSRFQSSTSSPMFKCSFCAYEAKQKRYLKTHMLFHNQSSEIIMHKCSFCDYETIIKPNLKRHMLVHKDVSEVKMHNCSFCPYETKRKYNLNAHMLVHKDVSEINMHKCPFCTFETKHKSSFRSHKFVHLKADEIKMYKCALCDYESKYKYRITSHGLIHKNVSEIKMRKSSFRGYETRIKNSLNKHMMIRKNICETKMYKCALCDFQTKYKYYLKKHGLIHQDVSEIKMHKCSICVFETKREDTLKTHMLLHKDTSEIKMYKCALCTFESKQKGSLKTHLRQHMTLPEKKKLKKK